MSAISSKDSFHLEQQSTTQRPVDQKEKPTKIWRISHIFRDEKNKASQKLPQTNESPKSMESRKINSLSISIEKGGAACTSLVSADGVPNPLWRFDEYRYQANRLYLKSEMQKPEVPSLLSLGRNVDNFTQKALKFLSPSELLISSALANYWEEIFNLVYLGGMLDSEFLNRLDEKEKWVEVYKDAKLRYLQDRISGKVPSHSASSSSKS